MLQFLATMRKIEDLIKFPLPQLTLREVLENTNRRYSMYPALSFVGQEPMLYEDFYNSVATVSRMLADHGIGHGDKVAILSENGPHWVISYFAVTCMGAVAVPILVDFHPEAIQHIIKHSEAKAVFVSEKLLSKLGAPEITSSLLVLDIESFKRISVGMSRDKLHEIKDAGFREFRKLRAMARRMANLMPTEPREDDVAAIIYTSGTSGYSKGVVLTHRNLVFDALLIQDVITITHDDRFLSILPLAHTYECTIGMLLPILHGAQIFYLDKPPTARVLLPALAQVKPTAMPSVPLVIEKIFKNNVKPKLTGNPILRYLYSIPFTRALVHRMAGKKLEATFGGCMRILAIGGAPLAPDVDLFLYEAKFPYGLGYGMTETSPLISGVGAQGVKLGTCGRVLPGLRVRINDPDPETGVGEICVKGPTVMREYYKSPELTEQALDEDGWMHTGDLGTMDREGFLFIKGRSKNMLLGPSGENIYPEEIEAQLLQFPQVLECLVYMHDGKLCARIHLDIAQLDAEFGSVNTPKRQEAIGALLEKMRNETNEKLASFARLHKIMEQPEPFEKTATQKIKRYLYV